MNQAPEHTASQNEMLKAYLLEGNTVTCDLARTNFGIGHLPRRILDLKQFHNLRIDSRFVPYLRKFDGKVTHVKQYYIHQEA